MTRARDIANLVDANGDIVAGALDNVPAADVVNDTTPQLGGDLQSNGNDVTFGTNDAAVFGSSTNLRIYNDGSNSIIEEGSGTGDLFLRGTNNVYMQVSTDGATWENAILCDADGAVRLRYNNSNKLETTGTGVSVTGDVSATGYVTGGSLAINTQSSPFEKLNLHDGNIRLSGTDDARIQFLNSPTASYNLGSSGGAAIRFHRPTSGHEAIAFETHDTGVAHVERMRIHPEGYVTMPYQPIASAQNASTSTAATQVLDNFNTVRNNVGNHFNNSTGTFTCPVAGRYEILYFTQTAYPSAYNWLAIFYNGGVYDSLHWNPDNNQGHYQNAMSAIINCAANDTLAVGTQDVNGQSGQTLSDSFVSFKLLG